jgi:hypothetical protein
MVGKSVPEPPFKKRPAGLSGTYSGGTRAFVARQKAPILKGSESRPPYWK